MSAITSEEQQEMKAVDCTFAIEELGALLSNAQTNKGYEGITTSQWSAIGIAIKSLANEISLTTKGADI